MLNQGDISDFTPGQDDDKTEVNKKETKRMLFEPNRFYM